MAYTLIDGVEQHTKFPATFGIPSDADKLALRPGHYVKVGVEFNSTASGVNGERFWLSVQEIGDGGWIVGIIDNDLVFDDQHGLRRGDMLAVELKHVLTVMTPPSVR